MQTLKAFLKNNKSTIRPIVIVFCLPVLLYLQTLSFDFTYFDDTQIITSNIHFLSDLSNAPQTFQKDAFLVKQTSSYAGDIFYRPLQTLSYMVDIYLSGGNNTWMYHLTNMLLLGLIASLLFLLLRKFLIPVRLALLGTLVYCVHPLFISSIAWIPARGDLLLSFFALISFLFFIEHLQKGKRVYLFLHWLTFTLALFCKETAAILPFLFIIYYFAFSSEKRFEKKHLLHIVLYGISGIGWFWLRSIAIGTHSDQTNVGITPFLLSLRTIPESLANLFLPFDITLIPGFSLFKTLAGLGVLILIVVLFFANKERSKKEKAFCLLWFLLLLLPTMVFKNDYYDYLNHRFFLPLIGILLFVLFSFPKKWFERKTSKSPWALVAIIALLSSVTYVKARSYADPITFWNSAVSQTPDNTLMYNNRGYVKMDLGNYQDAINDFTKALELNPKDADAYCNRGFAYSAIGDLEKAVKEYDKAIALKPNFALAYFNRGNAYRSKGDLANAVKDYDKTIALNPNDANAYNNRGNAYYNEGYPEMAIKYYSKAIELDPYNADAYCNRGIAYRDKGLLNKALPDFKMFEKLKDK